MLEQGTALRYKTIIQRNKVPEWTLSSILIALVESDYLHGSNSQFMDIDKFLNKDDKEWVEILNFTGVVIEPKRQSIELPRVQKLRLLCDSLLIALKFNKVDLSNCIDLHYTIETSNKVGNMLGISFHPQGYSDEADCLRILDELSKVGKSSYGRLKSTIKRHLVNSNEYYNFKGLGSKKLVLPECTKEVFDKYDKLRNIVGISFIPDEEFKTDIVDYDTYVSSFLIESSMVNIITKLLDIYRTDKLACTFLLNNWITGNAKIKYSIPEGIVFPDKFSNDLIKMVFANGDYISYHERSLHNFIGYVVKMGGRLNV